jgi:hypothetical protein
MRDTEIEILNQSDVISISAVQERNRDERNIIDNL